MKITRLNFLSFLCLLGLTNCKKDKPDCGCNSETVSRFTNSRGMLNFDSIQHKYVIYTPYAGGVQKNYVCDSTIGKLYTIYTGGVMSVPVTFSGELARFCTVDTVGYIDLPTYIRLSSISQ